MTVRKTILNEPKRLRIRVVFGIRELLRRFGYFCASKVTKRIGVPELLRRFGYFCASKVTKRIGVPELLRRFGYFWASKVTKKIISIKE